MSSKGAAAFTFASLAAGEAAAQGFAGAGVNLSPVAYAGMGGAALGAAWMGSKLLMDAARRRARRAVPEPNIEEIIPLIRIDSDNRTVIAERAEYSVEGRAGVGKHECRFVVVECEGVDFASTTPEVLETFKRSRANWQGRLAETETAATVIFERRLLDVEMPGSDENEWLRAVNDRWADNFKNAFANRLFILLVDEGTADLGAALEATTSMLAPAKPRVLEHVEPVMTDVDEFGEAVAPPDSELWKFLYDFVNTGMPVRRLGSAHDLPRFVKGADFEFDEANGTVRVTDGIRERFQKFVVLPKIERERIETNERLMRQLLMLNHELTVTMVVRPRKGVWSKRKLKERAANRDISAEGMSDAMREDYSQLSEGFTEGEEGFTESEIFVRVDGETVEATKRAADAVIQLWTQDENFRAAVATGTVMNEWQRRFPGAGRPIRQMNLGRGSIADWMPLEGTPKGLGECWWGPHALRVVKTINGGAYHLGVHEHPGEEALGNAALIGKPGSGKTVAAAWMITGALSYFPDMQVFSFDNLHGLSVPTRVFGGVVVTPGQSRFAPLQMEDTTENRVMLIRLLMEMADASELKGREKREAEEEIEHGLDLVMPLPVEDRTLANFVKTGVARNSDVGRGLRAWVDDGPYAGWMDGDHDSLNLSASRWITFDMTRLLGNPRVLGVYMAYVMHRIELAMWGGDARSHIIFIDEAPTMFDASPLMAETGKYLARNIRKKKGAVWFAFQDAEGMSEAGSVIVSSCATLAFWRNPNVNKDEYGNLFNLSESDLRFIADEDRAISHLRHAALFVHKTTRGQESTPVNLSLTGLGDLMGLFRSGEDAVDLAHQCIREFGDERWIRPYLEQLSPPA